MAMDLRFDGRKVTFDMASQGMDVADLARKSKLSGRTVYRFINNEVQSLRAAKAISQALGYSLKRYLMPIAELQGTA